MLEAASSAPRAPWSLLASRPWPLAIAHRGDSVGRRENTLSAVAAAAAEGVDAIEIDVRFTAGGVPMLLHDASLHRTTGIRRRVETVALPTLRGLEVRRGSWIATPDERVPTFAQALSSIAGRVHVLAEVKVDRPAPDAPPTASRALVRTARAFAPAGGVTFISFDPFTLRRLRSVDPTIELGILASRRRIPDPVALAAEIAASVVLLQLAEATRQRVAALQERGLAVLVYTADGPAIDRALASGADGILANDPSALLRRLGR